MEDKVSEVARNEFKNMSEGPQAKEKRAMKKSKGQQEPLTATKNVEKNGACQKLQAW